MPGLLGKMRTAPAPLALSINAPKRKLQNSAAGFYRRPRGSLHSAIRSQCEPLLRSVFFDEASVSGACAVLEFSDVARNSRQLQFFVVMIRATLETRPFQGTIVWHAVHPYRISLN